MKRITKSSLIILLLSSISLLFEINKLDIQVDAKTLEETIDAQKTINLIKNSDFTVLQSQEGKWTGNRPIDWGIWIPKEITTTNYLAEINDDGYLVLSSKEDDFRAAVTQRIEIDSNKTYELSFKVKTDMLTNVARIRLNEQNHNGQTNLWYSKSVRGTSDWENIIQDFKPSKETTFITLELFFEKGTGTLFFDDIALSEKEEDKNTITTLEEQISIDTESIYVTNREDYRYEISDSSVAIENNGMIYPSGEGETTVRIYNDKNIFIKEIPLTVVLFQETKYRSMLEQWNDVIAGNKYYKSNNSVMVAQNNTLDTSVEDIISLYKYNENSQVLWEDITDYKESANITKSYRRLETLSKQINQPASKFYQSPEAIRIVKNAMKWMNDYIYNENISIQGNWWDYEIGAPRAINNVLSLMKSYFTEVEILAYTEPINYFVPDPYQFRVTLGTPFKALGGNLIDMGRVKIISGALREDEEAVKASVESLQQAFNYAHLGESGFYEDGSYIDHDNVALTGAYGSVLIDGLSQLLPVVLESNLLSVNKLDNLYEFIENSFLPLIYKGEMMDMTRGRAISRENLQSHAAGGEVLRGIMRIAAASEENHKLRLNTQIKTFIQMNTYYDIYKSLSSYKDIDLMDQLLADESIMTIHFPNRLSTFNEMSKVAYQNVETNFGLGISMYSNKMQNYEYMNKENARGWYTSDGAVYLYNDDLGHYNDNYWATINPYYIPGTTIIPTKREDGSGMVTLPNSFVGATKLDDTTASVAMDFTNWDETLNVKKSWFIFNNKVVFLGSGIQTKGDVQSLTTIENRKNSERTDYDVLVNGQNQSLNTDTTELKDVKTLMLSSRHSQSMNIGYLFLEKTSLTYSNTINQGSWQDINASQSATDYSNNFLTFYQTHYKQDDDYAYVMYPNVSNEQLTKKENEIQLLKNDNLTQAVYDVNENSWGVVLYENQSFKLNNEITLTQKGIYTVKKQNDRYVISFLNPVENVYTPDTVKSSLLTEVVQEASNKDQSTIIHLSMNKQQLKEQMKKEKKETKEKEKQNKKETKEKEKQNKKENKEKQKQNKKEQKNKRKK